MPVTRVKLNRQSEVVENVDWGTNRLVNLADPVDPQDAVTLAYMEANAASTDITIGPAEDGDYSDGLFTDFTVATPVGTAVDRFNEIFKSLTPQGPPIFSSTSCLTSGVSGKLSFGETAPIDGYANANYIDYNNAFNFAINSRLGILNANTTITGVLANNTTPNNPVGIPFPNCSFSDGNVGMLYLEVNGYVIHQIDLATFDSGTDLNANGSGFTLSAATPIKYTNGDPFEVLKYRTGSWVLAAVDQTFGYNTLRITHEVLPAVYRDSQVIDWVIDADTTATIFNSESLTSLVMTGSKKISGVEYHLAGTFKYNVTILNAYRNTYSSSATAISYNPTNATITKDSLPAMVASTDTLTIANKACTISASRLLNSMVRISTTLDRTLQTDVTSDGVSITGILLDTTADGSTTTVNTFNGETRRINNGLSLVATGYGSGAAGSQQSPWDSTQSLVGANANHNTGLLVYGGQLIYPKTNFAVISNGPLANVNYSAATGLRTWIGFFYDSAAHSNFRFNVACASTVFVPVSSGATGNNLTFEVLAPSTTKNTSAVVSWKDATITYDSVDGNVGCYASTYGNVIPSNWGCTIGTKNTSTAGNVILIKITAAATWTGNISSVGITWL
jgi:hypothetical protein